MGERYEFTYGDDTVYRRIVDLVAQYRLVDADVVVDIGCGYGVVAEPLADLGLTYIGFDSDPVAIGILQERSIEAEVVDFADAEHAVQMITKRLGDRRLSAVVLIDSLEHLTNGEDVLAALQRLAVSQGCVPMFLAVPNVAHVDLVGKLLLGRWDMTEVGLLDDTHVAFFADDRLRTVMQRAGWLQVAGSDFELPESDQHFPSDAAALQTGAPLREFLHHIRNQTAKGAITNEFVRAYSPVATPTQRSKRNEDPRPLLSVLMRTQNARQATLQEALLSLAAQSCDDFELILLPHNVPKDALYDLRYVVDAFPPSFAERVRVVPVDGGGRSRPLNVGVAEARGDYVAILDDDDVVFGHWVESFQKAAAKQPGRVLRAVAAEQDVETATWPGSRPGYAVVGRPYCRWSPKFDVVEHFSENHSPPCGWVVPRSIFRDMGVQFDETLPVLEDWDVLMQAALWNGVVSIEEVTAIWRRWRIGDSSTSVHSENEWARARMAVLAKFDEKPLLLPPRTITKLHDMNNNLTATRAERDRVSAERDRVSAERDRVSAERDRVSAERDRLSELLRQTEQDRVGIHDNLIEAHRQLTEIRSSTSWKVSKLLRVARRFARRGIGRQP